MASKAISKSKAHNYDALLVVSFGGPEGPADVNSFLDNVFRGLRVPPETKAEIAKRYEHVGGVSPINAHTRDFIKALQLELDAHGPALPIYWGTATGIRCFRTPSRRWPTPACAARSRS